MTGLGTGTHTVTVKPNLDETKYTWGEIKVQIVIGRKVTEAAQRELMVQEQPRAQQQAVQHQATPAQAVHRHRAAHRQETPEITALTVHHIDRYITERINKSGSTKNNNQNPTGLHLRQVGNLCKEAMKFKSKVTFIYDEKNVANKLLLSVLGACIKSGDEIELICNGEDESEALEHLIQYIKDGLGSSTQGKWYTWRNIYGEAFNHSRSGLQC